tara:strand:+ start:90 stop:773 length:684 start_codon:yes stop_codon:yes gene_type:complete
MKRFYSLLILFIPFIGLSQELKPTYGFTLVNISLVNEYDIPYPNTKINFIANDGNNYSIITDSIGKNSILLKQPNSYKIICIIGENSYEYERPLIISKEEDLITINANLRLEFYSEIIELSNLYFSSNEYLIKEEYKQDLKKTIEFLLSDKSINIEIAGHTDNIGNKFKNQKLSERRAVSVKEFLVKNGINEERIICIGYGELQPIVNNSNNASRAKNRRIEIRILK